MGNFLELLGNSNGFCGSLLSCALEESYALNVGRDDHFAVIIEEQKRNLTDT